MARKKRKHGVSGNPARRMEQEAQAREEHIRTVLARQGDPRYVQIGRGEDGRRTFGLDASSPGGAAMAEGMEGMAAQFREKFGRDPGPEDPLFFNPDADEPEPMTQAQMDAMYADAREMMRQVGMDPGFIHAFETFGYMITEENRHTFTAHEVAQWEQTIDAYHRDHPEGERASASATAADRAEAARTGWDEEAATEAYHAFVDAVADLIEQALAIALEQKDLNLAVGSYLSWLAEEAPDEEARNFMLAIGMAHQFATLANMLPHVDTAQVLDWAETLTHSPLPAHDAGTLREGCVELIDLITTTEPGHEPDLNQATAIGSNMFACLFALEAGSVATAGDGLLEWRLQYEPGAGDT